MSKSLRLTGAYDLCLMRQVPLLAGPIVPAKKLANKAPGATAGQVSSGIQQNRTILVMIEIWKKVVTSHLRTPAFEHFRS